MFSCFKTKSEKKFTTRGLFISAMSHVKLIAETRFYSWRSISAKIQCSILHCALHNLSYILCLSFEFALAIQLFFCIQHSTLIYATFKFSLSTCTFHTQQSSFRIRPSSSVGCTFTFSHPTFSIFPLSFCPTLGIVLASFRIRHSTFRIELLPAGQPQMETVGSIDLTHPRSNGGRESVDADSANRNNFVPSQSFT